MILFTDYHHADLFYGLHLALEKRFGWTLYRPIGMEWNGIGLWKGKDPDFLECILSKESWRCQEVLGKYRTLEGKDWAVFSLHLTRIGTIQNDNTDSELYHVQDLSKNKKLKAITLEGFKNRTIDLIISSLPENYYIFEELRKAYQPKAKHVFLVPGVGINPPKDAQNVLTTSPIPLPDKNFLKFKQEFDLNTFSFCEPFKAQVVRSYSHFPETEKFWNDLGLSWDFRFIGKTLGPIKDIIIPSEDISREMAMSGFTLHIKPGGESYGHILHNSYAVGRPVITRRSDFINTAGGELLSEDTAIFTDDKTIEEIRKELIKLSEPETHNNLCRKVRDQFDRVVDFGVEADNLKSFLERAL
jgi:hypothetical protein